MDTQPRPLIVEPFLSKKDGKWRVRIKGANGEKVVSSQAYATQRGAVVAATRLRDAAAQGFELRLPL